MIHPQKSLKESEIKMNVKLITREIESKLKEFPIHSQGNTPIPDQYVICKYFYPRGTATWLVLEGEELPDGDWEFFGACYIYEWEFGYFRLSELTKFKDNWGLGIERDRGTCGYMREVMKHEYKCPDWWEIPQSN